MLDDPADLTALLDSELDGVVIDTSRGLDLPVPASAPPAPTPIVRTPTRLQMHRTAASASTPMRGDDIAHAEAVRTVNRAKQAVRQVFDGARLGKAVESEAVVAVVDDVTAAIEKNRRAFLKVLRLRSKDEYTYVHSVAVCALMIALARQLDLDEPTIADMGMAGLLHDVGKMAVPLTVLNKPAKLTDEEFALMQTHPEKGFRLLEETENLPALALDVCRHHHEKIDGTGYPHRLRGDQISLAARMGAICDVYDALTSNRAYKPAWMPLEAITRMREWEGQFDPELLFEFMKVTGVFAIGMIVQLRTNRLGLVVDAGKRATRARVLAFYSTSERTMIDPVAVGIGDDLSHDTIIAEADPAVWGLNTAAILALDGGLRAAA